MGEFIVTLIIVPIFVRVTSTLIAEWFNRKHDNK